MTAGEVLAKLQSDPAYLARIKEQERIRDDRASQWREAEIPLLADLETTGTKVASIWDLVNTSAKYEKAIPVLLKHLLLPYPDRVREGIARALAVPEARFAWPTLLAEYRKVRVGGVEGIRLGVKDGLAAAIAVTATESVLEELIALAKDRSHGSSRLLLLSPLRKSKNQLAKQALRELATDPDLSKEIASWKN